LAKHAAPGIDALVAPLSVPLAMASLILITAAAGIAMRRS
jgi:hypothetical protein